MDEDNTVVTYKSKMKYTAAYVERWIRPLPSKPTHPHDAGVRVEDLGNGDAAGHKRTRHRS